ncbi:hypothetical protein KQI46_15715 [Lysinibacillus capsici]|uniref:hypothetical protein n=1 Tax=Lysinibacillus capsici TaxID=2115968 RepID=UPI001C106D25|nr:hypothetical protein [Lysinibacillus capsici]MBU5253335.1 hypothetical protein [Lysinibacillus capsici]
MVFRSKKKDEKVNTKGLIEMKQDQLAEVEAEMTTLTNECNDLWQQYVQYQDNGETLMALETKGQFEYTKEKIIPDLEYKRQMLIEELGGVGVDGWGYRTGLVGEAKHLQSSLPLLDKQLKAYGAEIEEEERRFAERIETIKRGIEETKAEMDNANQRLSELLGGL